MKPGGGGPAASPESESAVSPGPPLPWAGPADVRLCGHLRKQKSRRRRFFVLRADPPRLECYESEKKFRGGGARPKLSVSLAGACTISKRVDARRRLLIVLYTRERSLGVAAASEAEQQAWYSALLEVRAAAGPSSHEDPGTWLLAPFQDVWPVTLRPKGLGRTRGLGSGGYRLCLASGILSLLRKPRRKGSEDAQASPTPALRLSLLSVRRCGHADSFFFLELGRSAPTGPGELWLQAPDAVVAQSIHETVLAAMKRLGDGAAGGRAEPRDPPTGASRPSVPPPYETLISAGSSGLTRGECLGERNKRTTPRPGSTLGTAASYPEGLEWGGGYISMGAGSDYEPMGDGEAGGYMVMAPPGLLMAAADAVPHQPLQESRGTEYVPMSRFPPGSSSSNPQPRSYKPGARKPGPRCSVGGNWGLAGTQPCLQLPSELAGEYVRIEYTAPNYVATGTAKPAPPDGRLNYVDLELVPPLEARGDAPGGSTLSYARIEFQKLQEVRNSCSISAVSEFQVSSGSLPAEEFGSSGICSAPAHHCPGGQGNMPRLGEGRAGQHLCARALRRKLPPHSLSPSLAHLVHSPPTPPPPLEVGRSPGRPN
ncbi:Insulin receptor substrate 1 [Galemys pyrenaicus]|uniref:Insulin receptor substrate 1 n=1 Tax=Galemys pyrenaicus TaxID=202257 RepID=A0A8J6DY23_GALPY|nr:Insulin receptor substrate 1 [Galemys pyrenaicus]